MTLYTYRATIQRIIDADTFSVDLSLGLDIYLNDQHIRLAHINAPEINTPAGKAAKAFVEQLLGPLPVTLTVQTLKDRQDNYGRYLGVFITEAGVNINEALVQAGHAVPYEGRNA